MVAQLIMLGSRAVTHNTCKPMGKVFIKFPPYEMAEVLTATPAEDAKKIKDYLDNNEVGACWVSVKSMLRTLSII